MAKTKSTANENVSAAFDRNITAGTQFVSDTKILYNRITELEGELEELNVRSAEKILEATKKYDAYEKKAEQKIANLTAQVNGFIAHQDAIVKAIRTPVRHDVKYTPDEE